jgi:hypothetical protein
MSIKMDATGGHLSKGRCAIYVLYLRPMFYAMKHKEGIHRHIPLACMQKAPGLISEGKDKSFLIVI